MSTNFKNQMKEVMSLAWQMVKKNGFSMSEALKTAWINLKLKTEMKNRIVKFYFQKVDGTARESYGTLKANIIPETGKYERAKNDTVTVYYDTERQAWRSFKKANLIKVVL